MFRFQKETIVSREWKAARWMAFAFLFIVLMPLFVIAHFNYPCSDDFSFAGALKNTMFATINEIITRYAPIK